MSDADLKQRFLFPDTDIRGEIVRLEGALAPALGARDYPMAVESLLAEALAAVVLMASTLKFRGRLSLQARGNGPVKLLLAESTDSFGIRGLAQLDDDQPCADATSLSALLGSNAVMAITIQPENGRNYQGMVPLEHDSLACCLEAYFQQSEQLPTRLWLAAGNGRAAGLLLQRLPEQVTDSTGNDNAWQHVTTLADTLTLGELLDLPAGTVLHRLFHEEPPQLPDAQRVRFACTCSRERVANSLITIGITELQAILDDTGEAVLTCDFCQSSERFDAVDLQQLIHSLQGSD